MAALTVLLYLLLKLWQPFSNKMNILLCTFNEYKQLNYYYYYYLKYNPMTFLRSNIKSILSYNLLTLYTHTHTVYPYMYTNNNHRVFKTHMYNHNVPITHTMYMYKYRAILTCPRDTL